MRVRGERECQDCGTRWSYFETGSVVCPDCGSLRSRGTGERERHTDAPADLDLENVIARVDEEPLTDLAPEIKTACRAYRRRRGFIRGGRLVPLDDAYVVAAELGQAADTFVRLRSPTDPERLYLVSLLRAADTGERPGADEVPKRLREARGLGVADSVLAYRRDVAGYLDDHPQERARRVLGNLRDRAKWIEARQGDVDPGDAEAVLESTRDLGRYLITDAPGALASARERLAGLDHP